MGPVAEITSHDQFKEIINCGEPVLIDFWAEWCGPCRFISPVFEKFAEKNPGLGFYKVDVDAQEEISKHAKIRAMPTFIIFNGGDKVEELVGANPVKLEGLVDKAKELLSGARAPAGDAAPAVGGAGAATGGPVNPVYDESKISAPDGTETEEKSN